MTLVGTKSIKLMKTRWIWRMKRFKKNDEALWRMTSSTYFFKAREWIEVNYDWLIGLTNQWTINRWQKINSNLKSVSNRNFRCWCHLMKNCLTFIIIASQLLPLDWKFDDIVRFSYLLAMGQFAVVCSRRESEIVLCEMDYKYTPHRDRMLWHWMKKSAKSICGFYFTVNQSE